jgi:hypothetical protein
VEPRKEEEEEEEDIPRCFLISHHSKNFYSKNFVTILNYRS